MMSITHSKDFTKPPINKLNSRQTGKNISHQLDNTTKESEISNNSKKNNEEYLDCSENKSLLEIKLYDLEVNTISKTNDECKNHKTASDCNQNFIETNSCSYEQLQSMINDLEHDPIRDEEVTVETSFFPAEHELIAANIINSNQISPKRDVSNIPCGTTGSTYEDIIQFLSSFEQDCLITDCQDNFGQSSGYLSLDTNKLDSLESFVVFNEVEIHQNDTTKNDLTTVLLKLEDRNATLKLLKDELKTERKSFCDKLNNQEKEYSNKLQSQKMKYQNVIKRHQKFIEQLIDEKKQLCEKCSVLAQKIQEVESKQHKELKIAVERHVVEVQRAKELCQASEKIRRARWLEAKTTKIKEMTVKGLEPELRNMVDQHQREIQDIRRTHMKELQEVELRVIRRSNQQLEQLRLEFTTSCDKILLTEKENLRLRYQEKFNEQETLIQIQQRKFFEELQQEKKKFAEEQIRRDTDRDMNLQQVSLQFQKKIEKLMRQFEVEKKALRETMEAEHETWIENYKRQQTTRFEIAEAKIKDNYKKERDRQIELAISRLEKETRDMKVNSQRRSENELQCLKDKYVTELMISKKNEESTREKLTLTREELDLVESNFRKIEAKLGQCEIDLNETNKWLDKITKERDHAKKLARQEIDYEKRELEEKIASLYKEITQINANHDSHMAQLYSRVKLIVTQKDITIKNISKEAIDIKNKCKHLEELLDQHRREYLTKDL